MIRNKPFVLKFLFSGAALFNFIVSIAIAQDTSVVNSNSLSLPGVMLIPYDPLYYLSDADHDIDEQSNIGMIEVRKLFHEKVDYYTYAALSKNFKTTDIFHDSSPTAEEDMITVFSTLGYKYEDPIHINPDSRKLKSEYAKKEVSENPATASKYKSVVDQPCDVLPC